MSELRDLFYAERDLRTRQCGGLDAHLERPVRIVVGAEAAQTRAGQVAALALINMVARVHRRVILDVPSAPLRAQALVAADELGQAMVATALAINPFLEIRSAPRAEDADVVGIGVGPLVFENVDFTLTWHGGIGRLQVSGTGDASAHEQVEGEAVIGAAAASVLGAWALFRAVHDQTVDQSQWNPYERSTASAAGAPESLGPLDLGHVQVVGAGAVASALVYWVRELGMVGPWEIVDADVAQLHNTNRCLCLLAADAGWPNGVRDGKSVTKVSSLAPLINATSHEAWYDEWDGIDRRPDLVLPLANARDVRPLIAGRGEPLLLHATTSQRWTAELHRHIPELDDCPACRMPDAATPVFECSTGPSVPDQPDSPDAALPFLSAAAGLLLATALLQVANGEIVRGDRNHWLTDFAAADPRMRSYRHPPREGCTHQLSSTVRSMVHQTAPRRWDVIRVE